LGNYFNSFYGVAKLIAAGSRDEQAEGTEASVDHKGDISANLLGHQQQEQAAALIGTRYSFCTLP